MIKNAIEGSFFLRSVSGWRSRYAQVVSRIVVIGNDSVSCKTIKRISNLVKACVVSISSIFDDKRGMLVIEDSAIIGYGMKIYAAAKKRFVECAADSRAGIIADKAKKIIMLDPGKGLGIIILTAATTNIIISLMLARQSNFAGWFIRADLLVLGAIWTLCKVDLREAKKTSFIFGRSKGPVKP
jgi:hypothetical protein